MRRVARRTIVAFAVLVLGVLLCIAGPPHAAAQGMRGSASSTPMMPGSSAAPTPRETPPRPFSLEWTLLLLVATVTAVGVGAYRVVRLRPRRAVSAVDEAVLVVDLVESTRLATHYGDTLGVRARNALKDLALATAERHGVTFAENTGDGWIMTFPSVDGGLEAARDLLGDLRERPPDLSPAPPIEARAAVTYGEILLGAGGGRHGAAINKAFRLVSLSAASFARVEGAAESPAASSASAV